VPAHLTLVSPVNLRDEHLTAAFEVIRRAAAVSGPLTLELGPATTFLPVTPTVHLAVAGPGAERLRALRAAIAGSTPLDRTDPHEWVPHVTLAQEVAPAERVAPACDALSGWRAVTTFARVHVLRQGGDRVWVPIADAVLGPPAVVGRGGFEVELSASVHPDAEAAALLAVDAPGRDGATPWALTARVGGAVVAAAWGWSRSDVAVLGELVVGVAHRRLGIGGRLLRAVEADAAAAGCSTVVTVAGDDGAATGLLGGAGWRAPGRTGAGSVVWQRQLG
jgi:2'-5' RNA ligase/GNAT superfamily N-acetyltransferase